MDVINIIKEAINYPLTDYKGWGMVAVVTLMLGVLEQLSIMFDNFSTIIHILSVIVAILLMGITLSIIRSTINGEMEIPMLDPVKNFIDGLKTLVVEFVYYVIPAILTFVFAIVGGVFSNTEKFILALNSSDLTNATAASTLSSVPADITNALFISVAVVAILAFVLFVIFALLYLIAQARLAETGDLLEAINIKYVFEKISNIGWGNYVLFIIGLLFTITILGFISGIVSMIPFVGGIISSVVVDSYLTVVLARAVGLVYNEG